MKNVTRNAYVLPGVIAAAGLAALACGLIANIELVIAAGAVVAFFALLSMPIRGQRARIRRRLQAGELLARWVYTAQEADIIAEEQRRAVKKQGMRLSLLFCPLLIILVLPFALISREQHWAVPDWGYALAALFILIPWIVATFAPGVVASRVRRTPCVTLIGRDCLIVANRWSPLNDKSSLRAKHAKFTRGADGAMARLQMTYAFKAMKTQSDFHLSVDIPVPAGREAEAEGIEQMFLKPKGK